MKKLLLVGLMLLLASCSESSENLASTPNANNTSRYQASIDTTSLKIKNTKEFASCMEPAVNSCITTVGMQLAQKSKDVSICNEILGKDQQEGCRFAIIVGDASEKGDAPLCNTLSGSYQTQCLKSVYRSLAVTTKNISICDKLQDELQQDGTGGTINENQERDQCMLSVIMVNNDASEKDCDAITDKGIKNICLNSIKSKLPLRSIQK